MNGVLLIFGLIAGFAIVMAIFGAIFDKAEKEADKGNGSCLGALFIVIGIAVVIMWIMQLKDCSNSFHGSGWEPRHTYIQKPTLNNVNSLIYNNFNT